MKFILSIFLLALSFGSHAQTAVTKPAGIDFDRMDTAYFKNIVAALVQDAEKGFPKTKGKDTVIGGQKVWRANNGISGALMVRIRSVQNKPLYETVLFASPVADDALKTTIVLAGMVGRALGKDYVNQSGANVQGGGAAAWQERFEPESTSGKAARVVLAKAEAQGGQHTVTLSILGAP